MTNKILCERFLRVIKERSAKMLEAIKNSKLPARESKEPPE
jgi:hypothetical protein